MKKLSVLAIMALALFSSVAFGARAYAKESDHGSGDSRHENGRDSSRHDNENNADDTGSTTDDTATEVSGM